MIISVTHEIIGQESILRIFPSQFHGGDDLALSVLEREPLSIELDEKENELNDQLERNENLVESLGDKREAIKDAILKLDEILVEKPNKPEIMKIIETLRNDLREAHE